MPCEDILSFHAHEFLNAALNETDVEIPTKNITSNVDIFEKEHMDFILQALGLEFPDLEKEIEQSFADCTRSESPVGTLSARPQQELAELVRSLYTCLCICAVKLAVLNREPAIRKSISDSFLTLARRFKQVAKENQCLKDELVSSSPRISSSQRRRSLSQRRRSGSRQMLSAIPNARAELTLEKKASFEDVVHTKVLTSRWVKNAKSRRNARQQNATVGRSQSPVRSTPGGGGGGRPSRSPKRKDPAGKRASRQSRSSTRSRSSRRKEPGSRSASPIRGVIRQRTNSSSSREGHRLSLSDGSDYNLENEDWTVLDDSLQNTSTSFSMGSTRISHSSVRSDMSSESLDELYERMDSIQKEVQRADSARKKTAGDLNERILKLQAMKLSNLPDDMEKE